MNLVIYSNRSRTRIVKFSGVNHLSLHLPKNFGEETTKVFYIGLKGDFTPVRVVLSVIQCLIRISFYRRSAKAF